MIDILIADNQALTREGVMSVLSNMVDINITGFAAHRIELEQLIIKYKPAIVIIDPGYSQRFTADDIKAIYSRFNFARILVLSNRKTRSEIEAILELGVKNYVFKECSREELVHAIYTTAKGEKFFCKNTFETLFGNKLLPEKDDIIPLLSSRETEIIHLIAAGLTNKEIAEKLFLSFHTIKTHRKNIIKKLGFTFKNTAEFASLIELKK